MLRHCICRRTCPHGTGSHPYGLAPSREVYKHRNSSYQYCRNDHGHIVKADSVDDSEKLELSSRDEG